MKFVFATVELAVFVLLLFFLGDWATGMLSEADDVSNAVGFVGGLGGAALLVYVLFKRAEFYIYG